MMLAKPDLPAIFFNQQMTHADVYEFLGGHVGVYSTRCPDKTSENEDAAAILPFDETSGVLVVADGMGGHAAGEVAARTAIEEMAAAVREARATNALLRSGILNGFERANRAVQALGSGSGTTLATVELNQDSARPYHAGDSAILVVGARGKIKLETTPHSPVGLGVEAGLLDPEEAMHHEERHVVLNAIGSDAMRIEIGSAVELAKRDTLLIASDGLTDNLAIHEIATLSRKGRLAVALAKVAAACTKQMHAASGISKPDDLTIVLFRRS
jgi:serine/threonine protein phosphatase PrpC